MSRLADLQQRFQHCVLQPQAKLTHPWISAGGRATPARQLAAYQYAYPVRLKEVLANDYPALLMAIGDKDFDRLAQTYLETHPSRFFSLRDFGGQLTDFIANEASCRDRPWLVELAQFEWSLGLAFDAADSALAGSHDMAAIVPADWPALRFTPHPSVHRLDVSWNTVNLWMALTAEPPTPVIATQSATVPWLIWREQLITRFRSLESDERLALDCLIAGGNFAELCEGLTTFTDENDVPLRAATLLKGWLEQGLISRIHSDNDTE